MVSLGSTFFTSCFEFWGFACTRVRAVLSYPEGVGVEELQPGSEPCTPASEAASGNWSRNYYAGEKYASLFWLNTLAVGFVC